MNHPLEVSSSLLLLIFADNVQFVIRESPFLLSKSLNLYRLARIRLSRIRIEQMVSYQKPISVSHFSH